MIVDPVTDITNQMPIVGKPADREVVISVRNIGKMYRIYQKPQDRLKQMLFWRFGKSYGREFWALQNISFEIRKGETVGIIGRNGSGKSTLLQIIAGTLAPTTGDVDVRGRVAALLELGSGFNPEFTGRENMFLNGTILGLSREEMESHSDEIAAFADIGEFLDQPVKTYSSGMLVRLAFAVQAVVPKDVLIVDEALAVGDEAFQRKCLARLKSFQEEGGSILLVSHDTQTIVRNCSRALLLTGGEMVAYDESKAVTDLYQKLMYSDSETASHTIALAQSRGLRYALSLVEAPTKEVTPVKPSMALPEDWYDAQLPQPSEVVYGNGDAQIFDLGIYNEHGERVNMLRSGRRYDLVYSAAFAREVSGVSFGMMLKTVDGIDVAGVAAEREGMRVSYLDAGSQVRVVFSLTMNICPGAYFLNAGISALDESGDVFLTRRVDVCMIKVLPDQQRVSYGIAYLAPQLHVEHLEPAG